MERSACFFRRDRAGLDGSAFVGHLTTLTAPLPEPDNLSLLSRASLNLIGRVSQFASPEIQLFNNFSLCGDLRAFSTSFGEVTQSLRILHGSSPERSSRNASPLTDSRLARTRGYLINKPFSGGFRTQDLLLKRR
jgi:hypothetical protein